MIRNPARSLVWMVARILAIRIDRRSDQGWELLRVAFGETEVIGRPPRWGDRRSRRLRPPWPCPEGWILPWGLSERQSRHSIATTSTGSAMPFRCAVRISDVRTSGISPTVSALARISPAPANALILAAACTPRPV